MSHTGWTPAESGRSNDLRRPGGQGEPGQSELGQYGRFAADAVAEQVVDLSVERNGDAVVVHVRGEVDLLTTPMLSKLLTEQFATEPAMLVLDLRDVAFLGSSGLAALVTARDEAGNRNVTLRLVGTDHAVLRPLVATGLAELFSIYPDLETALER